MVKKSKPVVEVSPEEKRKTDLQRFLKEDITHLPEPTYYFNIGDRVEIGALINVYICDIIDDGKGYEIDYSTCDIKYGQEIWNHNLKQFVRWIDVRLYKEEQPESLIKNNDLRLSYSQRHLGDILSKAYFFGTDFEPEYQREYVWNLEDKVDLIDSIYNNVDIGKFVFIHKDYGEKYLYEILDGKQRIRAILDFYENRFPFRGKYYNDLCVRDRYFFREYSVSIAEVSEMTRADTLRYFVRLNKHGKIMDKSQIEKVEKMLEEELKSE